MYANTKQRKHKAASEQKKEGDWEVVCKHRANEAQRDERASRRKRERERERERGSLHT